MRSCVATWATVLLALPLIAGDHPAALGAVAPRVVPESVATSEQQVAPPEPPVATPATPDPRIGAIFVNSADVHSCTGSIIHSATGDLVLTAAHCMAAGDTAEFVPAFDGSPADPWHVDAVFLDPRWLVSTDPHADYAILRVHRDGSGPIEQVVAPGLTLGDAPAPGSSVTVTGYPSGVGGGPVACRAETALSAAGFPSLNCAGLVDGTSGAPWRVGSVVRAVTGGVDGGGCYPDLSYAAPLDSATAQLLRRAQAGGPGDDAPDSVSGTC
jgi:hypothetical protein